MEWERVCRAERNKGGEWDNCNSIINILKKENPSKKSTIFLHASYVPLKIEKKIKTFKHIKT